MRIQILVPDDAEAFQELRLEGLQKSPTTFSSSYAEEVNRPLQEVARRLGAEGSSTFGAFTEEGRLVGVAGLNREQHVKLRHKVFIWGMYVTPEFRGRGIGRALLEAALSQARELEGVRQVNLTVITPNQAAHALYLSCGFEVFGLEPRAVEVDGIYYDVTYMKLQLAPGA